MVQSMYSLSVYVNPYVFSSVYLSLHVHFPPYVCSRRECPFKWYGLSCPLPLGMHVPSAYAPSSVCPSVYMSPCVYVPSTCMSPSRVCPHRVYVALFSCSFVYVTSMNISLRVHVPSGCMSPGPSVWMCPLCVCSFVWWLIFGLLEQQADAARQWSIKSCLSDSPILRPASKATSTRSLLRSSTCLLLYIWTTFWSIPKTPVSFKWGPCAGSLISSGSTAFCQPEKVSFLSGWVSISRLRGLHTGNSNGRQEDWSYKELARAKVSSRHCSFANFNRRFIQGFSKIALPLAPGSFYSTQMLRKIRTRSRTFVLY